LEQRLEGHNGAIEDAMIKKYVELRQRSCGCSARKPYLSDDINDGRPVSFYVIGEDFPKLTTRAMFAGTTVADGWEDSQIYRALISLTRESMLRHRFSFHK
jgi:hypothetical protein